MYLQMPFIPGSTILAWMDIHDERGNLVLPVGELGFVHGVSWENQQKTKVRLHVFYMRTSFSVVYPRRAMAITEFFRSRNWEWDDSEPRYKGEDFFRYQRKVKKSGSMTKSDDRVI